MSHLIPLSHRIMKMRYNFCSRILPKHLKLGCRLGSSILSLSALTLIGSHTARGVDATWNGTTNAAWATTTNWSASPVPGSGNTATFNNAGGVVDTITTGSITINTILFNTANAAAYILGGATAGTGQITLNDAGALTVNSTVVTNQLINANVVLGTSTASSAFTFTNNSTTTGQLLNIAGNVGNSAQANATRTKTLTLAGSGNGLISGVISGNGSGNGSNETATVALTKSGAGTWTLSQVNIYAGTTTVSGGKLTIASGDINGTSGVSIGGGEFNYNSSTALSKTVTFSGTVGTLSGNGTITPAITVSSGNIYTSGGVGAAGTRTLSGGATFNSGSIFQWDLDVTGANTETHDQVVANSLAGSGAEFKVVLASGDTFALPFWDSTRNWTATDLFGVNNANSNLATIFSSSNTLTNFTANSSEGTFSFTSVSGGHEQQPQVDRGPRAHERAGRNSSRCRSSPPQADGGIIFTDREIYFAGF